jgi:hypothetical protein
VALRFPSAVGCVRQVIDTEVEPEFDPAQRWFFRSPLTTFRLINLNRRFVSSFPSCGKRSEATKVATKDNAGKSVPETQPIKSALIAELTWAQLYTKAMQKDLVAISTAVSKGKTITAEPEMKETAEKLHNELQTANSTVGQLSDHAGIRPAPTES